MNVKISRKKEKEREKNYRQQRIQNNIISHHLMLFCIKVFVFTFIIIIFSANKLYQTTHLIFISKYENAKGNKNKSNKHSK